MDAIEAFRQTLIRFLCNQDRNGVWTDEDCDREDRPRITPELAVPIVGRWAINEIEGDMATGRVPATVRSFAELHDHVDANGYGGAFSMEWDESEHHCRFWNGVQEFVDRWLNSR